MHMHFCPPARSGVATRTGRMTGRGITRPAQAPLFGRGRLGTPGQEAKLYPCAARGAAPLSAVAFRERDRYPNGPRRDFRRRGELLLRVEPGPRLSAGSPPKDWMKKECAEFSQNQKSDLWVGFFPVRSAPRLYTGIF